MIILNVHTYIIFFFSLPTFRNCFEKIRRERILRCSGWLLLLLPCSGPFAHLHSNYYTLNVKYLEWYICWYSVMSSIHHLPCALCAYWKCGPTSVVSVDNAHLHEYVQEMMMYFYGRQYGSCRDYYEISSFFSLFCMLLRA